ncbi:MAG: hypothetical protein AB8F95_08640 [Bacteroidia bacterium]
MLKYFLASITFLIGGFFLYGANTASLWVEVVQVRLQGQEYPGFRVAVAQDDEALKSALIAHFAKKGKTPILEDGNMLFEQVAISETSQLDLFYSIQKKGEKRSSCTLVGLDPSRKALSGGYRAGLARNMLQDWDRWLHPLAGQHLTFTHLLGESNDALQAYQDTVAILKSGIYAYEAFVEEQEFLIDSLLRAVRRNPNRRKAIKIPFAKSEAKNQILRDSLINLRYLYQKSGTLLSASNHRIDSLENKLQVQQNFLTQLAQSQKQLEGSIKTQELLEEKLGEAKADYLLLKARLAKSEGQRKQAESTITGGKRRLATKLRLAESKVSDLERKVVFASREVRRDREFILDLSEAKKSLSAQAANLKARSDSLSQRAVRAENMAVGLTRRTVEMQANIDSLRGENNTLAANRRDLLARQDSLLTEIDLLGPYSREARARRHVYQEQLAILQDLERRLPAREQSLHAREKLLLQREKYILDTDRTGNFAQMKKLLDSLISANQNLQKQLLNDTSKVAIAPVANQEIYMSTLAVGEQVYPAFCLEREASVLALREGLIDFFREKMRLAPAGREPLSFQRVSLPGIANQRYTLTFAISDQLSNGLRRISCTFHPSGGDYLGPYSDENAQNAAKAFLRKLFP